MYSENKEIKSRIDEIVTRIVNPIDLEGWEFIKKVYKGEVEPKLNDRKFFHSYHNSLNLAFLLLNEESFFSQVFWKTYALTYQVSNNLFIDDLNVNDVKNIIASLEKESKENKTLELSLSKFKNFISQNGLLRTLSRTQIEFAPTLHQWKSFGALAVLNDSNASLDSIIHHGKSILTRIIFYIYGLRITSGLGSESYSQPELSNKDIEFLIKRDLLKKASKKNKDRYKELISVDFNANADRDYVNAYIKSEELTNQIEFKGEIEDDLEAKIGFYGIFDTILEEEVRKERLLKEGEKYQWGFLVSDVVSNAIETLRDLVDYREQFFRESFDFISIDQIALITGLSNTSSIKNVINEGEIETKNDSGFGKGTPSKKSTMKWALDKKRKYKIYEPIDEKPFRDLDFSYLSEEIKIAKEKIEQSKKDKVTFLDSDTFARTDKEIFGRVADHNKDRWEWIGKGKTFKELNEKNSTYRKNIKRKTYKKNKSPITQDILYDLNSGYIKQIK